MEKLKKIYWFGIPAKTCGFIQVKKKENNLPSPTKKNMIIEI